MPLPPPSDEDRRRSIRLRRSTLTTLKLEGIDRPSITIATKGEDLLQAFRLVRQEYGRMGYIQGNGTYHFSVYNLLPETCVYVFKSYDTVIASLTQVFDSPEFGLPMDSLYGEELDALRSRGRSVSELTCFVTSRDLRWRNLMTYLCKAMFVYSKEVGVDDLCIMVNPRHVPFYKRIFLFDDFGPERHYEQVNAPAVALRIDMHDIDARLEEKYSGFAFETDLHTFFCRMHAPSEAMVRAGVPGRKSAALPTGMVRRLLNDSDGLRYQLSDEQGALLESLYPGVCFFD